MTSEVGHVGAGVQTLPNTDLPPGGHGAGMRSSAPGERVSKGRSSQTRPQSWRAPVPGAGSHHAATARAAKDEAAKNNPAKGEAAKDEAAKAEAAKDETAKDEAAKDEAAKGRAAKDENAKYEAAKDEAAMNETATSDTEEAATADTSSEAAPEVMLAFSDRAPTNQLSCQAMGAQRRRWIRELSRAAEGLVSAARAAAVLGGLQDPGIRAAILPQINRVETEVNSKDLVWEQ